MSTINYPAHSLGAFRGCRHGDAIAYTATLEATGSEAVTAILRQLENAGLCAPIPEYFGEMSAGATMRPDYYAVLDIVDAEGCWFDNRAIPTKAEFDRLREALSLRIKSTDCEDGCN